MRGAKTACAFVPENHSPMGAGMVWVWVFPYGGGAVRYLFAYDERQKKFLKNLHFCVDIFLTLC